MHQYFADELTALQDAGLKLLCPSGGPYGWQDP